MTRKDILQIVVFMVFTIALCFTIKYVPNYVRQSINSYKDRLQSENITEESSSDNYQQIDNSSTKWKDFAGTTYIASQWISNGVEAIEQNYGFSYNRAGEGKYIIWGTMPGTHFVTDKMEFNIYKVESNADCLYLYCSGLHSSPVRIRIKGHSLYTSDGSERYNEQ